MTATTRKARPQLTSAKQPEQGEHRRRLAGQNGRGDRVQRPHRADFKRRHPLREPRLELRHVRPHLRTQHLKVRLGRVLRLSPGLAHHAHHPNP